MEVKKEIAAKQAGGKIVRFGLIIIILLGSFYVLSQTEIRQYLHFDQLRAQFESWGALAPIAYLISFILAPIFFIPVSPLPFAGGMLFGPILGSILSISGAMGAAVVSFYIARYLARGLLLNLLQGKLKKIDDISYRHGFWTVLIVRLSGVPFSIQNYVSGLSQVRLRDYLLASLAGIVPWTIAISVMGDSFISLNFWAMMGAGAALLIIYVVFFLSYRAVSRRVVVNKE